MIAKTQKKKSIFLKSALTLKNPFMPSNLFFKWILEIRSKTRIKIKQVPLSSLNNWRMDNKKGAIVHQSGKFFSIEGIKINTNWGTVNQWEQPIINQPEVGFLGIITKKFNDTLFFLMQAKIEPGNINYVQLSPTLQATKSNYDQTHKGKKPLYLEYFNGEKKVNYLLDQLQSEQGARFLKKRNRNIIVEIDEKEEIEIYENFCWLTLGQIKQFLTKDNIVNMDTRTIISAISFEDYFSVNSDYSKIKEILNFNNVLRKKKFKPMMDNRFNLHSLDEIISWITHKKFVYNLEVNKISLNKLNKWVIGKKEIFHEDKKYFSIIGVSVEIEKREVQFWDQPMIKPQQKGIIAFIIKKIGGVYHFLVQAKIEAGNFDIIELAPTVQCLTGNYRKGFNAYEVLYSEEVLSAKPNQIWNLSYQSEEGGRFYREENKNMIIEVDEKFPENVHENYMWMTLYQLKVFLKFNNYLNISARSLIASI